jgi:hypothetical protein
VARTHRPDVELCRDQPFHGLVNEVGEINESVGLLNMKVMNVIYKTVRKNIAPNSLIIHISIYIRYKKV